MSFLQSLSCVVAAETQLNTATARPSSAAAAADDDDDASPPSPQSKCGLKAVAISDRATKTLRSCLGKVKPSRRRNGDNAGATWRGKVSSLFSKMATPRRKSEKAGRADEHSERTDTREVLSTGDITCTGKQQPQTNVPSSLSQLLVKSEDELIHHCKALGNINTVFEDNETDGQNDLDDERKKSKLLRKRFKELATINHLVIDFMNEYKEQNRELKLENKQLKLENDSLFSQKLQDKEAVVQNLLRKIKRMNDKHTNVENEYRDKLAGNESEMVKQTAEHEAREASLLNQLYETQEKHGDAARLCQDLKMQLQKMEQDFASMEKNLTETITRLTKDKEKFQRLSEERGKAFQKKQDEAQYLELKWREEKKARVKAEDRFAHEVDSVNADAKVKALQSSLDEARSKYERLHRDLRAFKAHSRELLAKERELNKKLCHLRG